MHRILIIERNCCERDGLMADIIIITVLAVVVFFIVRNQLGKLRKGQCGKGCGGCCGGCNGSCEVQAKRAED